ncbi:type II toxin-antitoxin system PemK/MazF family toxin [Peptoniphilaceae bacterium SGI.137]|nr:type II toxin-antitoxin system PemK/MazF family toxin [Peptoniphilaceae bacterium]MCI6660482.1 type II toxin-antitoxin system PemK/MazF family toxin [Peptoniphilaceae bacterium]MDY3986633.1 type II toxin-antitoxin system PemK/MazF family toxin [Peptoniphilaceae bacterium]MDY4196271.1 type II toxin-antitoxin system PemK/MazF family toxin [Peptoniphilaceae bacterium]MDY5841591.1 type II toxin-antitoxin system PemK/MazF family toxin [Peptoniphilaceae bacterium]
MVQVKRGDIFFADLSPVIGSEQGGVRPVVVIQNNVGNQYSPTTIVAPMTSQLTRHRLPTHVRVKSDKGLPKDSVILMEQIRTIDKKRLLEKIGSFGASMMNDIDAAIRISIGLKQ